MRKVLGVLGMQLVRGVLGMLGVTGVVEVPGVLRVANVWVHREQERLLRQLEVVWGDTSPHRDCGPETYVPSHTLQGARGAMATQQPLVPLGRGPRDLPPSHNYLFVSGLTTGPASLKSACDPQRAQLRWDSASSNTPSVTHVWLL